MKVTFKNDKTIIELKTTDERQYIFNALKFYQREHILRKEDNVDRLLDKWDKEAESHYLGL